MKSLKKNRTERLALPSARILEAATEAYRCEKAEYKAAKQRMRAAKKQLKAARKGHKRSLQELEKSGKPASGKRAAKGSKTVKPQ